MIVKLAPALKDYLWGGENLLKYYNKQSPCGNIAEAWELSFNKDGLSSVVGGKFAGKHLCDVVTEKDLGANCLRFEVFPVLNKLLDAAQNLSVQVHPADGYALKNEGQYGKTEMWHILGAVKDAYIYLGFNRNVTKEQFIKSAQDGTVCDLLNRIYVRPGQSFFIPAGTVHAVGAGVTLFEIQQNSSLSYRIYDYDRVDKNGNKRELHLEKAAQVLNFNAYSPVNATRGALIGKCKYFSAYRYNGPRRIGRTDSFVSVTVVDGTIRLGGLLLKTGETAFISAGETAQVAGTGGYIVTCVEK